jgi:hypothetical protein
VTYTFTGAAPTAVATKIGSGAYTQASLLSDTLTIGLPSGTINYSVAYACLPATIGANGNPPDNIEYVISASTEDGTSIRRPGCIGSVSGGIANMGVATALVNAAAIPGVAQVGVGYDVLPWSGSTLSFSNQMVAGTYDVFVYAMDSNQNALAVRILRNQTIPGALNGGNPVVFDASDETVPETITYQNVPAGFSAPTTHVQFLTFDAQVSLANYATSQYPSVPSDAVQSGDDYAFSATAGSSTTPSEWVGVEAGPTSNGGPQTFTFPAPWSYAGPTPASLPTFNFDYDPAGFPATDAFQEIASINWSQGTTSENQIEISATSSYQNGATTVAVPDLSGLNGFIPAAPSGTVVLWQASIIQGLPLAGAQLGETSSSSSVGNSGTYIAP